MSLLSATYGRTQCNPGDPVGRFEGTAVSAQAGTLDVSLDLLCADGHYSGTLNTPLGPYTVVSVAFEGNQLRLEFAQNGVSEVIVEARTAGKKLEGTFRSGDDKGSIQLQRTGDALPLGGGESGFSLTSQQWKEDLAYFTRELPKRHPDAFAYTSKENFEAAIAELVRKIDRLNSDGIYIGLDHLANLIGDAHTYVEFPDDRASLPLEIRRFGSESRVVAVASGYEQALGTRVIAIQDTPLTQAREFAATITPIAETESLKESRIDSFLSTGMALHGLGVTPDRNSARFALATDDGKHLIVDFRAFSPGQDSKWVYAARLPLSEQPVTGSASCTYLRTKRTLYCNIREIGDLADPSRKILGILKDEHPDKLVIDLRHNSGGDYNVGLKYLIEPLAKEKDINRKGHLFVLVGPNTFSAAMSNAAQFRKMTSAILVGQRIGERPNSYQEPRQFILPSSHLVVHYSTRYYKFTDGPNNEVVPDKEITPTWIDYKGGRDRVLEWVLALEN